MAWVAVIVATLMLPALAWADPAAVSPRVSSSWASNDPPPISRLPSGWGVVATANGRSLDLRSRDRVWMDDPRVRSGETVAGMGWRRNNFSAVLGYQETDVGPRPASAHGMDPRDERAPAQDDGGVLGLGLAFRTR